MFVWFESAKNPVCIATIEMKLVDFFSCCYSYAVNFSTAR